MNLDLKTLTDLVALRLGELPDRRFSAGGRSIDLEQMTALEAEEAACRLTVLAPLSSLDTVADMRDVIEHSADWGEDEGVTAELPADFLRLRYIRLIGWPIGIANVVPYDDSSSPVGLRLWLGANAPAWMAAQTGRVGGRLLPPADVGSPHRIFLTPHGSGAVKEALYIPKPTIRAGFLCNISTSLIAPLADEIAALIKQSES